MGAINSLATFGLDVAAARRKQQAAGERTGQQRQEMLQEMQLKKQDLLAKAAEDRRVADVALKRRLAQERARAGAAGVSSTGGSIDAVLNGLSVESRAEQGAAASDLQRRLAALEQSYGARRRQSLLEEDDTGSWLKAGSRALSGLSRNGGGLRG